MIISASYRTDIPAFYGEWFIHRLHAGYCKVVNPYGGPVGTVSLRPADVDGFVFWSKNIGPFMARLGEVSALGFPFIVQHAINGYPRALEASVVDAGKAIEHARTIAATYGPRCFVWRYDPILITSVTPAQFHVDNFGRLAQALQGATDEVIVSFAHVYKKTRRNLDAAAAARDFTWQDPEPAAKRALLGALVPIARSAGMRLSVCTQIDYLVDGVSEARCIDALRMTDVAGKSLRASLRGTRPGCGCYESREIGDYDTCPHGCTYCYAVDHRRLALARYRAHDPHSEFLFPQAREASAAPILPIRQASLFGED